MCSQKLKVQPASGDGCTISTSDNTNDYIGLEIRANGAGGPTMLLRSSTSGVNIDSSVLRSTRIYMYYARHDST